MTEGQPQMVEAEQMQDRSVNVVDVHAVLDGVEAEVALAGLRVLGVGQPEVVEDAAVAGPHLQAGQPVQVPAQRAFRASAPCTGGML